MKFNKNALLITDCIPTAKNGHFLGHLAKIGQNVNFYLKSGRAIFYPYCSPQLHAEFQKIVGAVSEITSLHPNIHPEKGDITELVAFAGSIIQDPNK